MATSVDEGTQRLSLMGHSVQDDLHAEQFDQRQSLQNPSARRSTFWRGFFRKQSSDGRNEDANNDDPDALEDSALLNTSASNFEYNSRRGDDEELDDYRDDGVDPSHPRRLLVGGRAINESSDDDDDDDDDEDEEEDSNEDGNDWDDTDKLDGSMGHSLLSSGDDDDGGNSNDNLDLFNMNTSEAMGQQVSSPEDDEDDDSGESDDDDDEDDDDDSEEDEEEGEGDQRRQRERVSSLPATVPGQPLRNFLRRTQSSNSGSYGDNRYSDDSSMGDYSSSNRKNIHGRIQGFGSEAPLSSSESAERFAGARHLRERLKDLTSNYRMRKMNIGSEDTLQRRTWVERFDDVVDRVLPPDPELDGYIDAFQVRGQASRNHDQERKEPRPSPSKALREPPVTNMRVPYNGSDETLSHRRRQLGNIGDASYIIFLECELQNKELEVNSWKQRVLELEAQVKRLKVEGNDEEENDDDVSNSSKASNDQGEEGESEIEWQTGVAEEGVLIDVEGSDQDKAKMQQVQDDLEGSTYMMMHAPDGPTGSSDDEFPIIQRRAPEPEKTKAAESDDEDFFPVLSAQNHDSGTIWMDTASLAPAVKTPSKSLTTFQYQNDNDEQQEDAGDEAEEDEQTELEYDNDDDGQEEEEESEAPREGALIELDDEPRKEDAKTTGTVETAAVVVSDDDDSVPAQEGMLLDLDESEPSSPLNTTSDDALFGKERGEPQLVELES